MILLFAACYGLPQTSTASALWPFPGETAVDAGAGVMVEHDEGFDELPYGIERVYTLTGPEGEIAYTPRIGASDPGRLILQPDAPLPQGEIALAVSRGTDSRNVYASYQRPEGLPDTVVFSTVSAPVPLCWGFYDLDDDVLVYRWHAGRLPCIHMSEPMVPGWVDLASDQVTVNDAPRKTSGLVPVAFPELLCFVVPDSIVPVYWTFQVNPEDVETVAGGALDQAQPFVSRDNPACGALDYVVPRWRPEEEDGEL